MREIQKGVPIPPRGKLTPANAEDFGALEVGDSFAVPIPELYRAKPTVWAGTSRLRSAVYQYQKRAGRKFTVRCLDGEIRVWRIA